MRLFVAISLPDEVAARVQALIDRLRGSAALKWCGGAELHLTTKFIGEVPDERLDAIEGALATLGRRAPFRVAVCGVGWFPNPHAPRIFWAGVDAPPGLAELAGDTDRALAAVGVPTERRPYAPHLTLGRVPQGARLRALREHLASQPDVDCGAFVVDSFALYETRPAPGGRYHVLARFPLAPSACTQD
jgi:2'-5' RNA ligase